MFGVKAVTMSRLCFAKAHGVLVSKGAEGRGKGCWIAPTCEAKASFLGVVDKAFLHLCYTTKNNSINITFAAGRSPYCSPHVRPTQSIYRTLPTPLTSHRLPCPHIRPFASHLPYQKALSSHPARSPLSIHSFKILIKAGLPYPYVEFLFATSLALPSLL